MKPASPCRSLRYLTTAKPERNYNGYTRKSSDKEATRMGGSDQFGNIPLYGAAEFRKRSLRGIHKALRPLFRWAQEKGYDPLSLAWFVEQLRLLKDVKEVDSLDGNYLQGVSLSATERGKTKGITKAGAEQ
jgi:hypothetical protein